MAELLFGSYDGRGRFSIRTIHTLHMAGAKGLVVRLISSGAENEFSPSARSYSLFQLRHFEDR